MIFFSREVDINKVADEKQPTNNYKRIIEMSNDLSNRAPAQPPIVRKLLKFLLLHTGLLCDGNEFL
jgi:hypothetical protein